MRLTFYIDAADKLRFRTSHDITDASHVSHRHRKEIKSSIVEIVGHDVIESPLTC